MSEIRAFHSHIEVYPYERGDCPDLEHMLSKYEKTLRKEIPIGYYIQNNILYLPRGINATLLEKFFNTEPFPVSKHDAYEKIKSGEPLLEPKNRMQENGIKFLCSKDEYAYSARYSQLGLNLDTGDGKSYATVSAILKLKIKNDLN